MLKLLIFLSKGLKKEILGISCVFHLFRQVNFSENISDKIETQFRLKWKSVLSVCLLLTDCKQQKQGILADILNIRVRVWGLTLASSCQWKRTVFRDETCISLYVYQNINDPAYNCAAYNTIYWLTALVYSTITALWIFRIEYVECLLLLPVLNFDQFYSICHFICLYFVCCFYLELVNWQKYNWLFLWFNHNTKCGLKGHFHTFCSSEFQM